MAQENEFFREVNEDYRRDQIAKVWKRYSGLFIALAVLAVGTVGGWRYWQHAQLARAEEASAQFDSAIKLAQGGKAEEADKAFAALRSDAPAGYRILSDFRAAAETGKRDTAAAAIAYDKLAADNSLGDGLRDLARLRAALLRLDGPDPAAALTSLQGLAAPTGTFRHSAREMLGLAALKRGDYEAAGRWFDQIAGDADTPQGLRQRVEVYEALVAGGPVTTGETKTEAVPAFKLMPEPQFKPEAEPEIKSTVEPEAKPAAEPETKSLAEPETKPMAEPEAKPTAEPEIKSAAEPEAKPMAEPEAKPITEPEAKPDTKSPAEPEAKPAAEPEVKPAAEPESKPTAEPESKPEAEPEAKPESLPEPAPPPISR